MNLINKYLLFFRQKYNKNKSKTILTLAVALLITVIAGFLLDIYIEYNNITNFIRTIIVAIGALIMFPFIFLLNENMKNKKIEEFNEKNEIYTSFKDDLSNAQRVNFSIIVGAILVFLHIIFIKPNYNIYNFVSMILLSIILLLIEFSQTTEYERELQENNYVDIRDYNHALKVEEDKKRKSKKDED